MNKKFMQFVTVFIIPHTEEATYSFRFPFWLSRIVCFGLILLLMFLFYLIYGVVSLQGEVSENNLLRKEKRLLSERENTIAEETENILEQIEQLEEFTSIAMEKVEGEMDQETEFVQMQREEESDEIDLYQQDRALASRGDYQVLERAQRNLQDIKVMLPEKGETIEELKKDAEEHQDRMKAKPDGWPTWGRISSGFGKRRDPVSHNWRMHEGIDISNSANTPISATAYGTVSYAGYRGGFGNLVIIDHGYGYETYYAHLNRIDVSEGESVSRGQRIGLMGSTGRSMGDHLHYEVRVNGNPRDPAPYL